MSKKNIFLGGVLAALVALAFIKEGPLKDWQEKRSRPDNILSGASMEQASRIEIAFGGRQTALEKIGDKWRVAGTKDFYVQAEAIVAVQDSLEAALQAELEIVSANQDKKGDFSATPESGALVALKQGETLLKEFIVGRTGPDYQSTYISQNGISETYLVDAPLNSAFWRNDWHDPVIFKSDKDKIAKIRFQYPTREFTLEKGEDGWSGTLPYKFSVDAEKLDPILDIMSGLSAADVPEQSFAGTGLEKNLIIVQAAGEGIDNTLMIGDRRPSADGEGAEFDEEEKAALYFAKRGDSDNIYLVGESERDALNLQISDLR